MLFITLAFTSLASAAVIAAPENVPHEWDTIRAWQPSLVVLQGCYASTPFDESGNFYPAWELESACQSPDDGNVFVRVWHVPEGGWAYTYHWFFVHDRVSPKHDFFGNSWQSVILWLDKAKENLRGVSYSAHSLGNEHLFEIRKYKSEMSLAVYLNGQAQVGKSYGELIPGPFPDSPEEKVTDSAPLFYDSMGLNRVFALAEHEFGEMASQIPFFARQDMWETTMAQELKVFNAYRVNA